MSDDHKPFTEYATRANRPFDAGRWGWIVAGVFALLFLVMIFVWGAAYSRLSGLKQLRDNLDEANADLAAARSQNQTNQDLIADLKAKIADLQQAQTVSDQMSKGLENEMRSDLESKDVTISNLQGRLTVNILDRVMFDSGEATLKPAGAAVMRKVATIFAEHPELKIQVAGHTDNLPIRPDARSRFASNWELSTARALAAVHYLVDAGGVDPHRLGAVGYGEYQPIADNSTAEGRARNRRIEIVVLPDEITNAVPAPAPVVATNSPPAATDSAPASPGQ